MLRECYNEVSQANRPMGRGLRWVVVLAPSYIHVLIQKLPLYTLFRPSLLFWC